MSSHTEAVKSHSDMFNGNKNIPMPLIGLLIAISLMGLYGVFNIMTKGHAASLGTTKSVRGGF